MCKNISKGLERQFASRLIRYYEDVLCSRVFSVDNVPATRPIKKNLFFPSQIRFFLITLQLSENKQRINNFSN